MSSNKNWQPGATIETLVKRAQILQTVRQFFADRGVLEVETPILSHAAVTDVHLVSFVTQRYAPGQTADQGEALALVTSPEYHMKRLLAAGSGSIYQISKCFRNEEEGRYHNPEFTMLEWYRPQFSMLQLINEVDDLLQIILDCEPADRLSYQKAFNKYLAIDPLSADQEALIAKAEALNLGFDAANADRDTLLQFLFTFGVEPFIGTERPIAIYNFPASQAALAELCPEDQRVAKRFEFYYRGVELANGFQELTDAVEQRRRFEADNQQRLARNLPAQPIDEKLVAALEAGMPNSSGVALGLDRLIMLAVEASSLDEVMAFTINRA